MNYKGLIGMGTFNHKKLMNKESVGLRELSLGDAPSGRCLRITRLCSDPRENCRLCALGLTPGTQVRVLSCGAGLMRLMVRDCSLALDAALARTVACEFADA